MQRQENPFNAELADIILQSTGKAGISLTQQQAQLFGLHIQLLLQWNTRFNLTRITALEAVIVKHLLDSLLPAKFLPSTGNALDVGTGAGFPGIPLKILYPALRMHLLDSSRKKVSFLANVAAALGLCGIKAVHGRWQDFHEAEKISGFQLITMRALKFEPEHIASLAATTLAPGGLFAWWGTCPPGEIGGKDCGPGHFEGDYRNFEFLGAFSYPLPGIERQRAVWVWKKTGIG
jgi:16S rRNA (guanine527-N7)-methyltransferase